MFGGDENGCLLSLSPISLVLFLPLHHPFLPLLLLILFLVIFFSSSFLLLLLLLFLLLLLRPLLLLPLLSFRSWWLFFFSKPPIRQAAYRVVVTARMAVSSVWDSDWVLSNDTSQAYLPANITLPPVTRFSYAVRRRSRRKEVAKRRSREKEAVESTKK